MLARWISEITRASLIGHGPHAPALASGAKTSIVLLEDGKLVPRNAPVSGRDTNSALGDFMDAPALPPAVAVRELMIQQYHF